MIGGLDIVIPTNAGVSSLEVAAHAVRRLWRDVLLVDGESGEKLSAYPNFFGRREILAFRTAGDAKRWDEIGSDPSLYDTLLHFIADDRELTIAADDVPSPAVRAFVDAVRHTLRQDIFTANARPQEAA